MNLGAENPGTDFFDHLVSRARGDQNALAPRLPSLFEPVRPLDVMADWEQAQQTVASADEGLSGAPTAQPMASPSKGATKAADSPIAEISGNELKESPLGRPRERAEGGAKPARSAMPMGVHVDPLAPHPTISPVPLLVPNTIVHRISGTHAARPADINKVPSTADRRMRIEDESVVPSNKLSAGFRMEEGIASAIFPADGEAAATIHEALTASAQTVVPHDVAEHRAATPQMTPRMIIEPKVVRPLMHIEQRGAEEAPVTPVVNVTIGRIEVRAMPDQSNTSHRRSETCGPKPMSLDEYLRQRGGRR